MKMYLFFIFMRLPLALLPLISLHIIPSTSLPSPLQPLCHDDERVALLQLKDGFTTNKSASSDPSAYPKVASWNSSTNCCLWDGVKCDENTGNVVSLNLNSSCLYGFINSGSRLFEKFSHLERLNLADNHFNYSQIPSGLGHLTKLTYLNLSSSFFIGQIPLEISRLSNLSSLDLSDVDISSQVPNFLANFSSLTHLLLSNCGLYGEFPNEIFQLPKLQFLAIQKNPNLTGYFPEFLSASPLRKIFCSSTSFSGNIPSSIGKLDSLEYLSVTKTKLSGFLPSSIGKLRNLTFLNLSYNNFSGPIPSFLQNLTQLTVLWFGGNQLTGQIPPWIGNLTQLTVLSFARNKLHGPIPQSLSSLTNLRTLNLYENDLNGTLDFDVFLDMKNLAELRLDDNKLSVLVKSNNVNATFGKFEILGLNSCNLREFPGFLRYQDELKFLNLRGNNIHGPIPKWIWNRSTESMVYMALNDNFLTSIDHTGENISAMFCSLSSLQLLDLSNNLLSGYLPKCLENSNSSLSVLNIKNNSFNGSIPQLCASNNGSMLRMIDLSHNQFEGRIPRSLANCLMLESLNVGNNRLLDVFPSWLGTLPKLRLLTLRSNGLHGVISNPTSSSEFQFLRVIDLSGNNFTGKLPYEYFKNWNAMKVVKSNNSSMSYMKTQSSFEAVRRIWTLEYSYSTIITVKGIDMRYGKIQEVLYVIDFSSNKFQGEIPDCIGNLQGLRVLNLSNNILSGEIPSSVGNISQLESLDLSQNELSGEIPQQLVQLTFLAFFNVSHNHLMGRIPRGNQLNTFENHSYEGNLGLCGDPLSKNCENSEFPKESSSSYEDKDSESPIEFNWMSVFLGYGCGIVFGVLIHNIVKSKELWLWKA